MKFWDADSDQDWRDWLAGPARPRVRVCEACALPCSGFLRRTQAVDGASLMCCEDCALEIDRERRLRRLDVIPEDAA